MVRSHDEHRRRWAKVLPCLLVLTARCSSTTDGPPAKVVSGSHLADLVAQICDEVRMMPCGGHDKWCGCISDGQRRLQDSDGNATCLSLASDALECAAAGALVCDVETPALPRACAAKFEAWGACQPPSECSGLGGFTPGDGGPAAETADAAACPSSCGALFNQ
jgi:hypothetical protein